MYSHVTGVVIMLLVGIDVVSGQSGSIPTCGVNDFCRYNMTVTKDDNVDSSANPFQLRCRCPNGSSCSRDFQGSFAIERRLLSEGVVIDLKMIFCKEEQIPSRGVCSSNLPRGGMPRLPSGTGNELPNTFGTGLRSRRIISSAMKLQGNGLTKDIAIHTINCVCNSTDLVLAKSTEDQTNSDHTYEYVCEDSMVPCPVGDVCRHNLRGFATVYCKCPTGKSCRNNGVHYYRVVDYYQCLIEG